MRLKTSHLTPNRLTFQKQKILVTTLNDDQSSVPAHMLLPESERRIRED